MVQQKSGISEDEVALYDRQIRLWGLDAQKRLRSSKILLIGLKGFGAEIGKNIVLAGIKSLVLLDNSEVAEEDGASQFLFTSADVGKNRAACSLPGLELLNPMVEISADTDNVDDKPDEFFLRFDVVCATGCAMSTLLRLDTLCHANKIKFFAGEVNGFFSYTFTNLGSHDFVVDVPQTASKSGQKPGESSLKKESHSGGSEGSVIKKTIEYASYEKAMNVVWSSPDNAGLLKKMTDSYFIMTALQRFRTKFGRGPSLANREEDNNNLLQISEELGQEYNTKIFKNPADFRYCFAELGPVCAITGGILAQEIIKAVSHKDTPHDNFFFYNGVTGSGTVEKIVNCH